ncbi:right-handed parallel beta-helix repeat-containing protein [Xanthobacter autotrophicus]|uniref:right-handed parallel beta-helix repeat-containing protein n=1 Tax=Xanthobacter autotrophicus TaxID=280 RepID=UPI0037287598
MSVHDTALRVGASVAINLGITRSDIPSRVIPFRSITLSGFSAPGDLGAGAIYVRGTSTGPGAIQDAAGTWWNLYIKRGVNAAWFGDLTGADAGPVINAAIAAIGAIGGGRVSIPPGTFNVATDLVPKSNVTVSGEYGATTLKVPDGNSTRNRLFYSISSGNACANFTLSCLAFEGQWENISSEVSDNGLVTLKFVDDLRIIRCKVKNSRAFSLNINECDHVFVYKSSFENSVRDMIAVWGSPNVKIVDNDLAHNDDDGISVNLETDQLNPVRSRIIISRNTLVDTGPIRTQAPKNVTIVDNNVHRPRGSGIQVGVANTSGLGTSSGLNVLVANNTITDVIDRAWFTSGDLVGSVNSRVYVLVNSLKTQPGALATTPGEINASGVVQDPYGYFYTDANVGGTDPIRASKNIVVRGNICQRTLPAVTTYSDWGFGQAFTKSGFVNHQVTDAVLRGCGILARLPQTGLCIEGNTIEAGRYGIAIEVLSGVTLASMLAKDCSVLRNKVRDADLYGIVWLSTASLTHQDIVFDGNDIDCDPYFTNSNRGTNGTWAAGTTPVALQVPNLGSAVIQRSRVRNCAVVITQTGVSGTQYLSDNLIFADPAASGFSTSNKGIGNIPAIGGGEQWWLQAVDSDPLSATYGQSLGTNVRNTSGVPSSGKWLAGMRVPARGSTEVGTAGSKYIVTAYARVTTGTGAVLNTDWFEMRCPTGN